MSKGVSLGVSPYLSPWPLEPLLPLLGRVRTWEMVAEKINHGFQAAAAAELTAELKRKRGIGILMLGRMRVDFRTLPDRN